MPTKPEQRVWKKQLQPCLDRVGGLEYERLELKTGALGVPDLLYTFGGTGFVENKYSRYKTRLDLGHWTAKQRRWARVHSEAGGVVFLFVGSASGKGYLLDPLLLLKVTSCDLSGPHVLGVWDGVPDPGELKELLRVK